MASAAVDHVDFVDPGVESGNTAGDLGQHAAGKDAVSDQFVDLISFDGFYDGAFIILISEDPGNVAHKDQFPGMDGFSDLACRRIGIDVVDLSVKPCSQGGEDGGLSFGKCFHNGRHIHAGHFTDKAHILLFPCGGIGGKCTFGFKHFFA